MSKNVELHAQAFDAWNCRQAIAGATRGRYRSSRIAGAMVLRSAAANRRFL
jgi:hypothetical protein